MSEMLITPEDVAAMLSVTPSWVRRAAREGDLPCVRLGRFLRFRRESVEEFIAARERRNDV